MGSVRRCIKTGFHQLTDRSFTLLNCFLDNEFISYAEVKKLQLGIRAQLFEGRLALPKGSIDNWVSIFQSLFQITFFTLSIASIHQTVGRKNYTEFSIEAFRSEVRFYTNPG